MSLTSGLLVSIDRAICFMIVVLPALGGDTMRPRWPLPMGEIRSTMRAVMFAGVAVSSAQLLVGEQRRQVLEAAAARACSGSLAVDLVDAQQRRVLLVAQGRAGWRPVMWSPLRRPNWRACLTDT